MKPMGSKADELMAQELARLAREREQRGDPRYTPPPELPEAEETEIAYPEDRYGIACIGCGIEMHLQMMPHRDKSGLLCGWVFCCEKCRPAIIGRRMWWGEQGD